MPPPPAEHLYLAGIGVDEPFQNLDRRRLAGAVRAQQPEALPDAHIEVKTCDGYDAAVPLDQARASDRELRTRGLWSHSNDCTHV